MIIEQQNEPSENEQVITEPSILKYPYQANNNIKMVLSSERITEANKTLFIESLKFLIYDKHNLITIKGEVMPKLKPSINHLWNISGLSKTINNRQRISRLLSYFKQNKKIVIGEGINIKPIWRSLSNGSLIKSRYSERVKYIKEVL